MIAWNGGTLTHDGEELYWETAGEADGREVVVLCHGAGGNHASWFQQVPFLAKAGYLVVTWDHRGFGVSTDRAGRSAPDVAITDLAALLDHLGVRDAHLVGQSMGGWTVLGFALRWPDRVRSLTLADSLGGCPVTEWVEGKALPGRLGEPAIGEHAAIGPAIKAADPAKAFLYQQIGGLGRPFGAGIPRSVGKGITQTVYDKASLAALTMPTLCIVGSDDQIFPPAWMAEAAQCFSPPARFVQLAGAGHSPYFEVPDAWNMALAEFLAATKAGAGAASNASAGQDGSPAAG